ncbi:UNVERIFIED_ORG: hypothetical protein FHR35_005508 [Microbispora rosea subsp. rosea]
MSPLRRQLPNIAQSERSHLVRLGKYRIDLRALEELFSMLKRAKIAPRLFVGGSHAPKGVQDIDDASWKELQDIKIVCTNPKITIHLGFLGAYALIHTPSNRTARILAEVRDILSDYSYPAISILALRPLVAWGLVWAATIIVPIVTGAKALVILSVGSLPVIGIATFVSLYSYHRRLRRQGIAVFSRRIREFDSNSNRSRYAWYRLHLVNISLGLWFAGVLAVQRLLISWIYG